MTGKFVSAAELMAAVLGVPDYEFVVIDHPISSAGAAELAGQAETACERIAALLLSD